MTTILACDPGQMHTGIVVVRDGALHGHRTIHAQEHAAYRLTIADVVNRLCDDHQPDIVAVEDVTPPRGFVHGKRQPINPGTLIGTAAVLGVVTAVAWQYGLTIRLVAPGGNGAGAYCTYPPELVSMSERRGTGWEVKAAGKGAHAHERSSWDVAMRALQLEQQRAAS